MTITRQTGVPHFDSKYEALACKAAGVLEEANGDGPDVRKW